MRCQCLDRGCIQDVLFRFGNLKTVLLISTSSQKQETIAVAFATPSEPIISSQVWWSVPTLALKSPRRISLSVRGVAEMILSKSSYNLSFTSPGSVIVGA